MEIQYQVMELDSGHLKERKSAFNGDSKRICFIPADLKYSNIFDTFEEAAEGIAKYGNDYTEYTIIPRIYLTR
jgi:hypothetical protein